MASAIIHICVAKEINKTLKYKEKPLLLGAIAPDISKLILQDRKISHFIHNQEFPDLQMFLKKYQTDLKNPFTMGYYIHLYTDVLWCQKFLPQFQKENLITLLNGKTFSPTKEQLQKFIYDDYTNLNISLIDIYNLELSLFYEPLEKVESTITEIPLNRLKILVDKMGIIIENSKQKKEYLFDQSMVITFIEETTKEILKNINELQKKP